MQRHLGTQLSAQSDGASKEAALCDVFWRFFGLRSSLPTMTGPWTKREKSITFGSISDETKMAEA